MTPMRLHGRTSPCVSSMPPESQSGLATGDVLRAEDEAHRLDEPEADAPGREQRLERPPVEEANDGTLEQHAHEQRHEERHGDGGEQVPAEGARQVRLEEGLRGIGRVGAQHEHLAVGHVDDAQQAERHGQPEGREQQDARERQPVDEAAHDADEPLLSQEGVDGALRGLSHARVRLAVRALIVLRDHALQVGEELIVAEPLDGRERRDARVGARALQIDARHGERERVAHLRVVLAIERAVKQQRRLGVAALRELLSGREPLRRARRAEAELREHGSCRTSNLVADLHLLERAWRRDHRQRQRIAGLMRLSIPDVRLAVRPEPQAIVAEGVQRWPRARVVERGQASDALLDAVLRRRRQPLQRLLELPGVGG